MLSECLPTCRPHLSHNIKLNISTIQDQYALATISATIGGRKISQTKNEKCWYNDTKADINYSIDLTLLLWSVDTTLWGNLWTTTGTLPAVFSPQSRARRWFLQTKRKYFMKNNFAQPVSRVVILEPGGNIQLCVCYFPHLSSLHDTKTAWLVAGCWLL